MSASTTKFSTMPAEDVAQLKAKLEISGVNTGDQDLSSYINYNTTQEISYSEAVSHNFNNGVNASVILEGDINTYTLQNVPDGGFGIFVLIQDSVGGHGVSSIVHDTLSIFYEKRVVPIASNINAYPYDHTKLKYHRLGSFLYIDFEKVDVPALEDLDISNRGFSSDQIDAYLIYHADTLVTSNAEMDISGNDNPTSASDAARQTLTNNMVFIIYNAGFGIEVD